MGLIKAFGGAARTTLADQWKEFIYCDAMSADVLMQKGQARIGEKSSNTKRSENIISDGSKVAVNEGQCMLIVENGRIVDFCVEPGEYLYQTGTEPSMLDSGWHGLKESFKKVGKRFTFGGQPENDQRVYYINTKEIMGNKVGVGEVPFRDSEFGFTIMLKGYGTYSYRITDPIMFYANVCGNVQDVFRRSQIDEQLKTEVQHNLQPALGKIALKGIAYDQLPLYTNEIAEQLNQELTEDWVQNRGISVVAVALASITPDAESAKKIAQFQESRVYTNTRMMGARLGGAQANAMENASKNDAGAMTGFMGLGMAQQAGGANVASFFENSPEPAAANGWSCPACGSKNTGNFCQNCGAKKPEGGETWICACGTASQGKFCPNCGAKKPE
jgi:membrane protease subunit (stomatin/prohibitin family)